MSKGKKFNATEKHFIKREEKYRKEQQCLYKQLDDACVIIAQLEARIADLDEKLSVTAMERDEALKLAAMSPDEMQRYIKQTKAAADVCSILSAMGRYC